MTYEDKPRGQKYPLAEFSLGLITKVEHSALV